MNIRIISIAICCALTVACKRPPQLQVVETGEDFSPTATPAPTVPNPTPPGPVPTHVNPDQPKVNALITLDALLVTAGVQVRCEIKSAKRGENQVLPRQILWAVGDKGHKAEWFAQQDLKRGEASATLLLLDNPSHYNRDLWCEAVFESPDGFLKEGLASINSARIVPPSSRLAAGHEHTCFITEDRSVMCWGRNNWGQLGSGALDKEGEGTPPVEVRFSKDTLGFSVGGVNITPDKAVVVALAAGGDHTCATLTNKTMQCWGSNSDSQLGEAKRDVAEARPYPGTVPYLQGIADGAPDKDMLFPTLITMGERHSCVVLNGGKLSCWGHNRFSQANGTDKTEVTQPTGLGFVSEAQLAKAGPWSTCATAMVADGAAPSRKNAVTKCWGKPVGNPPSRNKKTVFATELPTQQVGIFERGSKEGDIQPVMTPTFEFYDKEGRFVVDVSAGLEHVCVLYSGPNETANTPELNARKVVCQGKNIRHQLGLIPLEGGRAFPPGFSWRRLERSAPDDDLWEAQFPMPALQIRAGADHTCALYQRDPLRDAFQPSGIEAQAALGVACWGGEAYGQHPVDSAHLWRQSTQVYVVEGSLKAPSDSLQDLASGDGHICVTTQPDKSRPFAARVVCWGNNSSGQAVPPARLGAQPPGNGRVVIPLQVPAPQNEAEISDVMGDENGVCTFSSGLASDPAPVKSPRRCWGFNAGGRFLSSGTGLPPQRVTPIAFEVPQAPVTGGSRPEVGLKGMGWGRICTWREGDYDQAHSSAYALVCQGDFGATKRITVRFPQRVAPPNRPALRLKPRALAVNEVGVCVTTWASVGDSDRASGPFLWCGDFAQATLRAGSSEGWVLDLTDKSGDVAAAASQPTLDSSYDPGKITAGRRFFCTIPPPVVTGQTFSPPICWGDNGMGQVTGTPTWDSPASPPLQGGHVNQMWNVLKKVFEGAQNEKIIPREISSGENHTCLLFFTQKHPNLPLMQYVFCWGDNSMGQFAHTRAFCDRVFPEDKDSCLKTPFALFSHSATDAEPLFATPKNANGVTSALLLTQLVSGSQHTCALASGLLTGGSGREAPPERPELFCWGGNRSGQLGLIWTPDADVGVGGRAPFLDSSALWPTHVTWEHRPRPLANGESWNPLGFVLALGRGHTCLLEARSAEGGVRPSRTAVFCWGDNALFQTSRGFTPQPNGYRGPQTPSDVPGL